jgi:hypothetical protein
VASIRFRQATSFSSSVRSRSVMKPSAMRHISYLKPRPNDRHGPLHAMMQPASYLLTDEAT